MLGPGPKRNATAKVTPRATNKKHLCLQNSITLVDSIEASICRQTRSILKCNITHKWHAPGMANRRSTFR